MSDEEIPGDLDRIETAAEFSRALRALRERSGLTIRQAARQANGPVATIGDYFSGRHLPTDRDLFTRVLAACGETDPARVEQWHLALGRARRIPGKRGGPAPYRGLARFEEDDARWFFGREEDTRRLAERATADSALPLVLIGPSGAGKSSLLRAGLLPRLDEAAWAVTVVDLPTTGVGELTERAGNLRAAAAVTTELASAAGRPRQALVVDQFEAAFTLGDDENERYTLITALCELAEHALVVLALRADFYGQAIRYPGLRRALQERHVVLGPMSADQVRSAVVRPARLAKAEVDERLIRLLLTDLAPAQRRSVQGQGVQGQGLQGPGVRGSGDAAYDQGALPLLSHALLATWNRSKGATLTVDDYLDSGGIRDALNQTAEHAYESLTGEQRAVARRLFLRLVHVSGDHVSGGTAPSRASVPLGDLPGWGQAGDAEQVLAAFVGERMITVDTDSAQITHDALLTAWPRLRTWIDESIGELRDRGHIIEGARAWNEAQREDAALWRGSRLGLAREWAEDSEGRSALSALALEFVDACVAAGAASDRAARRRTRWLQSAIGVLAVLVLAVASLSGYAFSQRAADTAASQANSRDLAFTADQLRVTDPAVAAQLAVSADEFARTPQSTASLLESSGAPSVARIDDTAGIVQWVAVSPDHKLLAAAANDGSLRLWNVASPGHPVLVGTLVRPGGGTLYGAEFSPDGKLLAAAGANQAVTLWNLSSSGRATLAGTLTRPASAVYSLAFSPDSGTLAAASTDGTVRLWDVASPGHFAVDGRPLVMRADGTYPDSLAFSPSGSELVVGTSAGTVWLWHLPSTAALAAGTARPAALPGMPLRGPANSVSGVAFSPSGDEIAAASKDFKIWLWHVGPDGRVVSDGTLSGSVNWANTVAFSPSGNEVAAGTSSSSVLVWNLATHQLVATLPHPQPVTSVAWDGPDRIAAGSADGTVSLWALPTSVLATGGPPTTIAYSPDGSALAVGASSIELWDTAGRTLLASRALPAHVYTNATVFQPRTGSSGGAPLLAVALSTGTVELLSGRTLAPVGAPFPVITGTGAAESVAFSPDGTLLATGADDGSVRLYDVTDPAHPRLLQVTHVPGAVSPVYTVVFSPDGRTLAAASLNDVVRLYRVTGGTSSASESSAGASPGPSAGPSAGPGRLVLTGPALGGMASYPVGLAFTPDGATLAVANADKDVYLFDVADPAHARLLGTPLAGPSGNVWAVSVSPDGSTLAASANDGTVWLWNIADPSRPALTATLSGLPGHVFSVAFSPDGGQLAAASYDDDTVRLWDTSPAAARAAICSNLGQPLSAADWTSDVPGVPYRAPCSG